VERDVDAVLSSTFVHRFRCVALSIPSRSTTWWQTVLEYNQPGIETRIVEMKESQSIHFPSAGLPPKKREKAAIRKMVAKAPITWFLIVQS